MIFDHSRSLSQHNALGVRLYFASHGLNLYSVLASVSSMFLVSSWWVSPLVKLLQTCYFFFVYLLIKTNFCCSSICRIRFHLPHSFTTSQGFFLHHQLTDTNQQDRHRCAQIRLDMDTVILRGTCRFFMSWICSSEEPTEHICLTVF